MLYENLNWNINQLNENVKNTGLVLLYLRLVKKNTVLNLAIIAESI